ncbi:hypothetical protein [Citricoccus muralis]|uniref:FtsX-like permease family protein n=1 Tax=Citricoccus muralis TaxID=169134 RepID=A0ABY8HA70_9MICC|nr:hypothetical protein [Citricoccus muralis]WFP17563.1 hypothetical protein P8192_05525 [Citricoccus muralis]
MTEMKTALKKVLLPLCTVAIVAFLLMAFAIVLTQLAGLLLGQGVWIDRAYEVLAQPSIISAISVGLLGYAYYYTMERESTVEGKTESLTTLRSLSCIPDRAGRVV